MYREYGKHVLRPTADDIEGPFYLKGAPLVTALVSTQDEELVIRGRVLDTEGNPIPGAILDIWQADPHGVYDLWGFKLRGNFRCDEQGNYAVHTVLPGHYEIGEGKYRCSHIHVKLEPPGYRPLTTQLYFLGDEHNDSDEWFDVQRTIQVVESGVNELGKRVIRGQFDFVLEKRTS